jgi:hypothetical protein
LEWVFTKIGKIKVGWHVGDKWLPTGSHEQLARWSRSGVLPNGKKHPIFYFFRFPTYPSHGVDLFEKQISPFGFDQGILTQANLITGGSSGDGGRISRFDSGRNCRLCVFDLTKAEDNKAKGDQSQYRGSYKKQLGITRQVSGKRDEPLIDRDLFLVFGIFAGEIILGFFGWNYFYDNRKILGSAFLVSGVFLACLGGLWL